MPSEYSFKASPGDDPVSPGHVNPAYTSHADPVHYESVELDTSVPYRATERDGTGAIGVDTVTSTSKKASSTPDNDGEGSDSESGNKDKKDKKEKEPMVGMAEMFRFSTTTDRLLMFIGTICACAHGSAIPLTILFFGDMSDLFIDFGAYDLFLSTYVPIWNEACYNMTNNIPGDQCENVTVEYIKNDPSPPDRVIDTCLKLLMPPGCEQLNTTDLLAEQPSLTQQMSRYSIIYVIIGCCALVLAYGQVVCWQTAAFNQSQRIRTKLFASILRQEIGWFDTHEVGELNTRISDDVSKIEGGIGDKLGLFLQYFSGFVTGIVIGFVYSWKLTLVTLSVSPLLVLSGMAMGKVGSSMTSKELKAYARAGAIAEEVFGAIRTVVAFGGESKECTRYKSNLSDARDFGIKKGLVNGISMGTVYLVMFGSYALGFWYGSDLVFSEQITPGNLLTVFFCVLIGTFYIGSAAPNVQTFAVARGAAFAIYGIIDAESPIDPTSQSGQTKQNVIGNIEFSNVDFKYPSRPDVQVLQGLSMKVGVGQTVALVGSSGCGKSTTVQLLQRFYDPAMGMVTLDGTDLRQLNVRWLRQQIGVVSQEPVLFGTTIAENIRYGHEGIDDERIIRACREANAHDFISKLPDKYETLVGERGTQLSGGQKQRIAIARALVRNPRILLLDEATSALDTESEATVQAALDKARMGRTTLVIAHRLSTIRTADVIIGVKDGRVVEQGTHDELMTQKGLYHELVMNQEMEDADAEKDDIPGKPGFDRRISVQSNGKAERAMSFDGGDFLSVSSSKSKKEEEEKMPKPEMKRIIRMNSPEWPLLVLGCVGATMVGAVQPAFAVVFGDIIGMYAVPGPEAQDKVNLYSGMFAVMGVGAAVGMIIMHLSFSRSGEYLTMRIREVSFTTILRQDMSYFDDHQNSVGALCTRLATDASAVQGATGVRFGMFCQAITAMGAGVVIGFIYSWEMTLAILAFAPIMLASGLIQMKVMTGNEEGKKAPMELAGKVAMEAISNIRTVATLTKEQTFVEKYVRETTKPHKENKKKTHIQGAAYGFSQAAMIFAHAACFQVGAYLVENRGLSFEDMFKVFSAIIFGASQAGEANSFTPNYSKAKASAAKIFALLDRVPLIDGADPSGKKPAACEGKVRLRDVSFNYPTRPDVPVLRGLDLDVTSGQTVALVGSSGCGKSTTVQLLQRFYDPHAGAVMVESEEIPDVNIQWLRSQMGIVSQEPMLFDCSIRDNIAYGDNSREVSMGEIIQAAKNANIHNFIESLPQGYDTNVGDKGTQLSGGQKQRVAIARALVRNPKILLLDEATSALDTESEKVVQAALDRAQEGRTCIVIAHRLSTIQNADCIVVIHHGKAVEMGTHSELLQKRGRYHRLNNAQLKKK